jgi:hypothetical protein
MGWLWVGGLAASAALVALAALWDRRRHRLRDAGDMAGRLREVGGSYLESPERNRKAPAQ